MTYPQLISDVIDHLDEWHTTDDDGVRRCDLEANCLLDCFQGSTQDEPRWRALQVEAMPKCVVCGMPEPDPHGMAMHRHRGSCGGFFSAGEES